MDAESERMVALDRIEPKILVVREKKVILDADLAALYGTTTKKLNQAVRRNADRFPLDFMFQVTAEEAVSLRSQIVTLKPGRGQHRKYLPFVFTEHGAIMAPLEKPSRRIGFKGQSVAGGGSREVLRAPRSPKAAS